MSKQAHFSNSPKESVSLKPLSRRHDNCKPLKSKHLNFPFCEFWAISITPPKRLKQLVTRAWSPLQLPISLPRGQPRTKFQCCLLSLVGSLGENMLIETDPYLASPSTRAFSPFFSSFCISWFVRNTPVLGWSNNCSVGYLTAPVVDFKFFFWARYFFNANVCSTNKR